MSVKEILREHLAKIVSPYGHHPGKTPEEAAYFYIGEPEEVIPGVYFFTSLGNSISFICSDRLMQVDCNTIFFSPQIISALRRITNNPIDTIAITHGHVDHCLGTINYVRDNIRLGYAKPRVIAHKKLRDRIDRYKLLSSHRAGVNQMQFQVEFNENDLFVYPDTEFEDRLEVSVGGEVFFIRYGNGHTDDSSWIYCPRLKVLCCGDLFQWTAPNVGNPFKVQRYARENAEALEEMAALRPEVLLPGHGPKILGSSEIEKALLTTARYLHFIQNHVIACMNKGMWEEEIVNRLKIPDELLVSKWIPPIYGHPTFIARGIYRRYGGYYTGNPAELFPPPKEEKAMEILKLAGRPDALLARARENQQQGKMELACQIGEWLIQADPKNKEGWEFYGLIFKERAEKEKNIQARGAWNSAVRNALAALEKLEKS